MLWIRFLGVCANKVPRASFAVEFRSRRRKRVESKPWSRVDCWQEVKVAASWTQILNSTFTFQFSCLLWHNYYIPQSSVSFFRTRVINKQAIRSFKTLLKVHLIWSGNNTYINIYIDILILLMLYIRISNIINNIKIFNIVQHKFTKPT